MIKKVWIFVLFAAATAAQRHLRDETPELCTSFDHVMRFAASSCNISYAALPSNCIESFEQFAQHEHRLIECNELQQHGETTQVFMQLYTQWQERRICDTFHEAEAIAAVACTDPNIRRPWHEDIWPLRCHEIYTTYNATRHEIDRFCARTANSAAFWDGFAHFTASPLCKQYYDQIRQANRKSCGDHEHTQHDADCVAIFQWYKQQQKAIEQECLEIHSAASFYHGYYHWKATL